MDETQRDRYLQRIGFSGPLDGSPEMLGRLVRAHLEHVPFENLDVVDFGKVPELDEETLYHKIVEERRGGYCFELNMLFDGLLRSLGIHTFKAAARIMWNRDELPPVSHMVIVADREGEQYLCDVGFGGPGPKGLLMLKEGEQTVDGEEFSVLLLEDGDWLIRGLHGGEWKQIMRFAPVPVRDPDFQLLNFYCARCGKVLFTRSRVVNLCTPGGSRALSDMELTVREKGNILKKSYGDIRELEAGLREEFGICVTLGQ